MAKFNTRVTNFLRKGGNFSKDALAITLEGVDDLLTHYNWDALARLIQNVEPKMGLRMRAVIQEALGGVTIKADQKHPTGLRFVMGDNWGPSEGLDVLRDMVAAGESIYGDAVSGFIGKPKAAPKKKTREEVRKHLANFAQRHGFTLRDLIDDPLGNDEPETIDH